MSLLLNLLSLGAFAMWSVFVALLQCFVPKAPLTQYLNTEVTEHKQELFALNAQQADTVSALSGADQILMFFSQLPITQARAAKRRYWKKENPIAFARLYKKLGYTAEEAEAVMLNAEKMPGYFRKKVHASLNAA